MAECIFCKIVKKEIPAKIELESEDYIVFQDINPQAPVHWLLVPKKHLRDITELNDPVLAGKLVLGSIEAAKKAQLQENGFRLVINTGSYGGQSVFHLHIHILGGRHMGWPPG